jgi:Cu(I)/Ag(I) efflux system membrane fusion protein
MQKKSLLILAVVFVVGLLVGRSCAPRKKVSDVAASTPAEATVWMCAMHPQIRQPSPGPCPLCAMDLMPVTQDASADALGPREIKLSPTAEQLAGVQVARVERRFVESEFRMIGKITYDETRVREVALRTEGVIERLFVNYEGVPMKKGDHLAEIYSPDVLAVSRELLVARDAADRSGDGSLLKGARRKLALLGVSEHEINAVIETGKALNTFTLFSPIDGILKKRGGYEGHWLKVGDRLGQIADLSTVWALLDAYESDIANIQYGQSVEFTVEAFPGRTFKGFVAFIAPELMEMTRTIKVRLNVSNPELELRPGMFVRATIKIAFTRDGKVVAPDFAEKWICPMHPEIVTDSPGVCEICEMTLVTPKSTGFKPMADADRNAPLVIPASAPLITGKRALVYVKSPDRPGVYEGREVTLGPRAGEYYIVYEGLQQGELVVVNGNFKIDSAIQLQAKPSMMNPESNGPSPTQSGSHSKCSASEAPQPAQAHEGSASEHEGSQPKK